MIDLIGFWSGVTLYTFLLLLAPAWLLVVVVDIWVNRITDSDVPEFLNAKLKPYLIKIGYFRFDNPDSGVSVLFGILYVFSMGWLIPASGLYLGNGETYVYTVTLAATQTAPFLAWITIVGGTLIALDGCAKKIYKLGKKVNKALSDEA